MSVLKHTPEGVPFLVLDRNNLDVLWHGYWPSADDELKVDSTVCQSCSSLILRLLHLRFENIKPRLMDYWPWTPVDHLNGKVASLRVSATRCQLCRLILGEAAITKDSDSEIVYRLIPNHRLPQEAMSFYVQIEISLKGTTQHELHFFRQTKQLEHNLNGHNRDDGVPVLYDHDPFDPKIVRAPPGYIYSPSRIQLVTWWMDRCNREHVLCNETRPKLPLPKRILKISTANNTIHLYQPEVAEFARYATLSYCWGEGVPLRTTTENISSHLSEIPMSSFPATLRDAIDLAKALGFVYIWIDALCIIQDDEHDWAEQAAQMTAIYRGGALNIAASDSPGCHVGIIPTIDDFSVSVGTAKCGDRESNIRIASAPTQFAPTRLQYSRHILYTRGWTLQETGVSVSTLFVFRHGISWECCTGSCDCDGWQQSSEHHERESRKWAWATACMSQSRLLPSSNHNSQKDDVPRQGAYPQHWVSWNHWVREYSTRSLTKATDKLPALAGIAAQFSTLNRTTYVAGLWREDLHVGLTWSAWSESPGSLVRDKTRAPSWSWASVDGLIVYPSWMNLNGPDNAGVVQIHQDYDLQILNVTVQETHPGTFGAVSGGRIDAVATLYPITVVAGLVGDTSKPQLRYDSETIDHWLDEAEPFKDTAPRPCWLARVYSVLIDGYGTTVFYLVLQENEGGKEYNLGLSRIGMLPLAHYNEPLVKLLGSAAGIRRKIVIL
ncbi:Heterokaryon incompatibility protein (HET) domain containing protein [Rhypophila sp. PSN 637]